MKPRDDDIRRTLEYGHTHDQAQQLMPFALGAIALGLFLTVPLDGGSGDRGNAALGWLVVAGALLFVAVIVYRRMQPSVPYIVVSERGVMFKLVSDRVIPWDEIRAVDRDAVSASRDLHSTKVVRLALSPRFFETLTRDRMFDSVTGEQGDPSYIYLAYALSVPHDELYAAVRRRWRAFSHHAVDVAEGDEGIEPMVEAAAPPPTRRVGAVQRAQSFEGLGGLARLLVGGSIAQVLGNLAALAVIAALVGNHMGLWSTAAQDRGRASQAEWRAWNDKHERERSALDADVKRTREMWDRKFECMNEYWDSHANGTYRRDPACMKEK